MGLLKEVPTPEQMLLAEAKKAATLMFKEKLDVKRLGGDFINYVVSLAIIKKGFFQRNISAKSLGFDHPTLWVYKD